MAFLNELAKREERLAPGHRLCPGCGQPIIVRALLNITDYEIVIAHATGCMEVCSGLFPYTSWRVPWIHSAFENAASTIAGAEAMYKVWKRKGKTDKDIKFVALASDGGTYDIGLQALSGALERWHDFLYVCIDNQAYQNTGVQRSSASPFGSNTSTTPVGKVKKGKEQPRKDIVSIAEGHHIPYVAQGSPHAWRDLMNKMKRGLEVEGPAYLNVIQPCCLGWRFPPDMTIEVARMSAETCVWPLYEVIDGAIKINYKPKKKLPIEEYFKMQGRFAHFLKPENKDMLKEAQRLTDKHWEWLLKREAAGL
ncbi:MAG: thiamine pyrophosphate-dependent enzyme [Campylobacterota bacterium]|nr:thiamine pyrophosphate-dependent enzyme [Campylobacterota bacterium]